MRQRLGIAAALLGDPALLILDEPANGLDPEGVHWLRQLLRELAGEGRTVLLSSHILAEVAQTVDEVVILDRGCLVSHSALKELTTGNLPVVRIRTSQADDLRLAVTARGALVRAVDVDRIDVTGLTAECIGTLAAELAIPIFESTTRSPNLEDVFFRLIATTNEPTG
jgi:ABC-2 type transport system ATP-binding protein